jgi:hypothetical protein
MSALLDLQAEIERTNEAVARAERALAAHPDIPSAYETLKAIVQRHARLQKQFAEIAQSNGYDVCHYAIETEDPIPPVRGVAGVLETFQRLFTTVYDAIIGGAPKLIERTAERVSDVTTFGFAFTAPGSLRVVMTVDESKELIPNLKLDEAMANVFRIMKAQRPEEIIEVHRRFGLPAVRIAREWASENTRARFGANVEWHRKDGISRSIRVQIPEIIQLQSAIDRASEKETETTPGELIEVNYEKRTFALRVSPDKIIVGTYENAVSASRPAYIPGRYKAELQISRRILPQDQAESVSYFLIRLAPEGTE